MQICSLALAVTQISSSYTDIDMSCLLKTKPLDAVNWSKPLNKLPCPPPSFHPPQRTDHTHEIVAWHPPPPPTPLKVSRELTMYMRMSRIMTIEVWWSFQAMLRVCRKLLFRAASTSSRTYTNKAVSKFVSAVLHWPFTQVKQAGKKKNHINYSRKVSQLRISWTGLGECLHLTTKQSPEVSALSLTRLPLSGTSSLFLSVVLPLSSFKSSLKTFLFLKIFSSVPLPWCMTLWMCVCARVGACVFMLKFECTEFWKCAFKECVRA